MSDAIDHLEHQYAAMRDRCRETPHCQAHGLICPCLEMEGQILSLKAKTAPSVSEERAFMVREYRHAGEKFE